MTLRQAMWFILGYIATVAAAIWFDLAVLCEGDPKFDHGCGGFGLYIPLWEIFLAPLPIAAIVLERWRRSQPPPTARVIAYLVAIMGIAALGFVLIERFPVLLAVEAVAVAVAVVVRLVRRW
jgi:hypothetical protein